MKYASAQEPHSHFSQFLFGSLSEKDFPKERVKLVAKGIKPKQECGGYTVIFWKRADQDFDRFFRLQWDISEKSLAQHENA